MTRVQVTTGSRLHFGLLCAEPESSWHYGGIGMMISDPGWHICLEPSADADDVIHASFATKRRVETLLRNFRSEQTSVGPITCTAVNEMPFHSGLGSGTQLTLAVGTGLVVLSGRQRPDSCASLAASLGRSRRSAIGMYGFDSGGFVTDRGRTEAGPQHSRLRFPDDWRMILISPGENQGLSGLPEEEFFAQREFLDAATLNRITDLVDSKICPAVASENYEGFSEGLAEYGTLVGSYYATEQGGIYSSPIIRELAAQMKADGLPEPVQSSWGPTVCVPARSEIHGNQIIAAISTSARAEWNLRTTMVTGMNRGAAVRTVASEDHRSFG